MAVISEAEVAAHLFALCEKHGVFSTAPNIPHMDDDLIENRGLDSMGAVYLQNMIEEEYSVAIPLPILVTELRSIRSVAAYIANHLMTRGTSDSAQVAVT